MVAHDIDEALKRYQNDFPFPVVSLAHDLGLEVYETSDFDATQSGSLRKENGQFVIYVKSTDSEARKRFTIAHEIGHFLYDQDHFAQHEELVDTYEQPFELRREDKVKNPTLRKREVRANRFAADLLMPKKEFIRVCKDIKSVEKIAKYFNVSMSAASIRANQVLDVVFM